MTRTATGGLGRASIMLASGTLVSRVLGFVNAAVLAAVIGLNGQASTAFAVANQLPNNVYAIIAGGLLSAVLVPQIVRAASHEDGGERFVNRIITLGVVVFLGITAIATLAAPLLVRVYANSGGQLGEGAGLELATAFAFWCLPQIFFYAVYSLVGEVLNARGVFGPFTWAPVLNNVVMIGSMLLLVQLMGSPAELPPAEWGADRIALLAGGATLGVAAQAFVLLFFWRRTGLRFRPDFRWRGVGLGATGRMAGWTFGMILVTQLAGIVQSQVATLADREDGSSRMLMVAWLVFMLPHSIIAVSIATPYFTRMSGHARDEDLDAVRADLSASLRTIGMLIFGAGTALAAAALPFAAFFTREPREQAGTAVVLVAYLAGLVAFSSLFLMQRTFYALGDTRTPFFVQLVQSALFVAGALAVGLGPSSRIAVGIAVVTTAAGIVQAIVMAALLRRRLGRLDGRRVANRYGRYALATIPGALAGLLVLSALSASGFATANEVAAAISVAAIGGAVLLVYVVAVALLRVPELGDLARPVLARLRRR